MISTGQASNTTVVENTSEKPDSTTAGVNKDSNTETSVTVVTTDPTTTTTTQDPVLAEPPQDVFLGPSYDYYQHLLHIEQGRCV